MLGDVDAAWCHTLGRTGADPGRRKVGRTRYLALIPQPAQSSCAWGNTASINPLCPSGRDGVVAGLISEAGPVTVFDAPRRTRAYRVAQPPQQPRRALKFSPAGRSDSRSG